MNLLLIITSSISAYKALDLIRDLVKKGNISIKAIVTKNALNFITKASLVGIGCDDVYSDELFTHNKQMSHIYLARWADKILVVPCSASFIGKMANGISDDLASTTLLANGLKSTTLVAPAMNVEMWQHVSTQRNISQLVSDGVLVIPPQKGILACGESGYGKLASIDTIIRSLVVPSSTCVLSDKIALITLGATEEALDPVRYISNHSSGKQGIAIIQSLLNHGIKKIIAITARVSEELPIDNRIEYFHVESAVSMYQICKDKYLEANIIICCAAVSDWYLPNPAKTKTKKNKCENQLTITLSKTPDILQYLCQNNKNNALMVGFAVETDADTAKFYEKKLQKGCDILCVNMISENFSPFKNDNNNLMVIDNNNQKVYLTESSKQDIANSLIKMVIDNYNV
jgi:phosphopantothenoylcysteine decarboxylase/phosphopantothenate--cysteine ligase